MKFNRISLLRFMGIMVLFFVSAGCATNYTIKGLDIPQMQTGSLLKGVSPKIFAFKGFKDVRWGDSYLVFKKIDYSFFFRPHSKHHGIGPACRSHYFYGDKERT